MSETKEQERQILLPRVNIFEPEGALKARIQPTDLESLTLKEDPNSKLSEKAGKTAEKIGLKDLNGQAASRIDSVAKMMAYEKLFENQTEVIHMDDEHINQAYSNYREIMNSIESKIPDMARKFVLLETLQEVLKEEIEAGNVVNDYEDSEARLTPDEAKVLIPMLEVVKVDFLVNMIKPGVLQEDYARPLNNINESMNILFNSESPEENQKEIVEIMRNMIESLKFVAADNPTEAVNTVHGNLASSRKIMPGNAIRYNPVLRYSGQTSFSVDKDILLREFSGSANEDVELVKSLDNSRVEDVFSKATTYHKRDILHNRDEVYDVDRVNVDDFKYFTYALLKINAAGLIGSRPLVEKGIDELVTKNENEGGYLSRIGFILDSFDPQLMSKNDLLKLAGAYVARKEAQKLAHGKGINARLAPILKKGDTRNPERQKFFDELDNLDPMFNRLFDNNFEPGEVQNARNQILGAVRSLQKAEIRWQRASLTSENIPDEFPGVLSFVDRSKEKLSWGRRLIDGKGNAVIRDINVLDGFPINE